MNIEALADFARPVTQTEPANLWKDKNPAEYAWIQSSTFDFAEKMRAALQRYGSLTQGQLAAVRKCMNYKSVAVQTSDVDLSRVPSGLYAVADKRIKIDAGSGNWAGYVFVTDQHGHVRHGMQRRGATYSGALTEELRQIAKDPRSASIAYGKVTGHCGICGLTLTNPESVARGIGPICAGRLGW